jgi:hypothetical protein
VSFSEVVCTKYQKPPALPTMTRGIPGLAPNESRNKVSTLQLDSLLGADWAIKDVSDPMINQHFGAGHF